MAWEDVSKPKNKPTDKQIQYAESLMEEVHGDIVECVRDMNRIEISKLIEELEKQR